jgi:hypothetical protein
MIAQSRLDRGLVLLCEVRVRYKVFVLICLIMGSCMTMLIV